MNKHQLSTLLLSSSFLIISSVVKGEAFTEQDTRCFAITALVSANYEAFKQVDFIDQISKDHSNKIRIENERRAREAEWLKKKEELSPYSSEYYRHQAAFYEMQAEWSPELRENYIKEMFALLELAKKAEQKNLQDLQIKAWDEEEATYTVNTPEWFEFKAKVEGAKSEWCDPDTEYYAILKSNQQFYLQQAKEAIVRRRQEAERQSRISDGRSQLQDLDRRSILSIVKDIFSESGLTWIFLTDDDLAEIVYYLPQYIKNSLTDFVIPSYEILLTGEIISKIQIQDWSAFSEIIINFDRWNPQDDGSDTSEIDSDSEAEVSYDDASPEIKHFVENSLKSSLKNLLNGQMDDVIDRMWVDIFKNFHTLNLDQICKDLRGRNLSDVADFGLGCLSVDFVTSALEDRNWMLLTGCLYIQLKFIDYDKISNEWGKIYNVKRDLDPRRAFDPAAPFSDIEAASVAILIQSIKREEAVKAALEHIFLKERAQALYKNLMGEDE